MHMSLWLVCAWFLENAFVHVSVFVRMDVITQLVLCLYEQTQTVADTACRVGIASNFLAR